MTTPPQIEIELAEYGLTFVDPTANMGVRHLGLRLTVAGQEVVLRYACTTDTAGVLAADGQAGKGLSVHTTATPVAGLPPWCCNTASAMIPHSPSGSTRLPPGNSPRRPRCCTGRGAGWVGTCAFVTPITCATSIIPTA